MENNDQKCWGLKGFKTKRLVADIAMALVASQAVFAVVAFYVPHDLHEPVKTRPELSKATHDAVQAASVKTCMQFDAAEISRMRE